MFSNLNRQYKKVNDLFENNLRVVVYKAEPHYYSVHLIRTKEPTDCTACMVKLTSTDQWRSVLKVLREINDLRKHSSAPPFFAHHCNDHANTKITSLVTTSGYLTTINVCRYRPTPPTGFDRRYQFSILASLPNSPKVTTKVYRLTAKATTAKFALVRRRERNALRQAAIRTSTVALKRQPTLQAPSVNIPQFGTTIFSPSFWRISI